MNLKIFFKKNKKTFIPVGEKYCKYVFASLKKLQDEEPEKVEFVKDGKIIYYATSNEIDENLLMININ